jgi:predicted transcriptional regulator
MDVHIAPAQESKLAELSAKTGRKTDELVQEAVERLLAHNEWFARQVQAGLDEITRGELLEDEEVRRRIDQMFPAE